MEFLKPHRREGRIRIYIRIKWKVGSRSAWEKSWNRIRVKVIRIRENVWRYRYLNDLSRNFFNSVFILNTVTITIEVFTENKRRHSHFGTQTAQTIIRHVGKRWSLHQFSSQLQKKTPFPVLPVHIISSFYAQNRRQSYFTLIFLHSAARDLVNVPHGARLPK